MRVRLFGETDRVRPAVSVASADVHHIYNLMLSRLFKPVRTFDLDARPESNPDVSREHTWWGDLLEESGGQNGEFEIDAIVDSRVNAANGKWEYLVRWRHYSDEWDSWESLNEKNTKHAAALAAYWAAAPQARLQP